MDGEPDPPRRASPSSASRRTSIITNSLKLTLLAVSALSAVAQAQNFHFTIDADKTGTDGRARVEARLKGNLIGTWDPTNNPTGTMTKPGEGPFGEDGNKAVCLEPRVRMLGPVVMRTAGQFDFLVDLDQKTLDVTNFSADLVSNGPLALSGRMSPNNRSFKTRNPEGRFHHMEDFMSLGSVSVDKFLVTQNGPTKQFFLRKLEGNNGWVAWAWLPVHVDLNFHIESGDHPVSFDTMYAVGGRLLVDGTNALLSNNSERGHWSVEREMNQTFDPFNLTITNRKGEKGEVVVSLAMRRLGFGVEGVRMFSAAGVGQ